MLSFEPKTPKIDNLPSPTNSPIEQGTQLTLTADSDLDFSLEPLPQMISTFDSLPDSLKSLVLVQLLKRSSLNTLQLVSSVVTPSLKQDFVRLLPVELCHQIFQYLDVRTLSQCMRVNRIWQNALRGAGADLAIWKPRILNEKFCTEEDLRTKVVRDSETLGPDQFDSYKNLYKRSFKIRQNWLSGKFAHTSFPGHGPNVVTCLQFDTEKIVSGSDDHTIHIYGTSSGELEKRLVGHDGGVWALQYHDVTLVSGSTDRTVRVWDMDTGLCTHIFDGHTSTVRCLLIIPPTPLADGTPSSDAPLIITGSRDTTLRVWTLPPLNTRWNPQMANRPPANLDPIQQERVRNPFFRHLFTGHTGSVRAIAGHGNTLVSGSYDCTVRTWDLTTGQNVFTFRGHREKVYSVGYSHELDRCVSGSMDASVKVWCTKTGVQLFHLDGHTSLVGLLELTPQYLISAAADATLRIWDPSTGELLANLRGHSAAITCLHHDPVYNRIVSGSDGGVKIWELSSLGYGTNDLVNASVIPLDSPLNNRLAYSQTPQGQVPFYGRFITDVLSNVQGVWRVKMDESKLVCACQREQGGTWFEVLDFSDTAVHGTHRNMPGDRSLPAVGNEDEEDMDSEDE
ncbi:WD40-repeat-containing domain protein [Gorgonomyces haynaldii]|nr:WD40-repeat-containing domain protein [Gorgonomyces haynaldii]